MAWTAEMEARWRESDEEVIVGLKGWRLQHPRATLREIETALDERLARVRARMLEDAALTSASADLSAAGPEERPRWAECGQGLEAHGQEERNLITTYDHPI